jgi:catechol 2,3-dioxygenase-like lactoylglutathione lyase family enzyme
VALKNVIGIDHAVVMVKDLDKAAENYKRLGFTVSPRGTHSAHMGSGNYTIMFDPDYMELLGVLTPTEHNAPARANLEKNGEGIERIAFTAVDTIGFPCAIISITTMGRPSKAEVISNTSASE